MKKENLIYAIAYTIVLVVAIMKILHYPIASPILTFSLIGITVFQSWHISQLKKTINELEGQQQP